MTNFLILYAGAGVLMLSALVALGVAVWALNAFRPRGLPSMRVGPRPLSLAVDARARC